MQEHNISTEEIKKIAEDKISDVIGLISDNEYQVLLKYVMLEIAHDLNMDIDGLDVQSIISSDNFGK